MFKRANKITSLLVAAAAVVSLVPTAALAADVKKIDSEDGTVYNAVAYKDGKAYVDGEINDDEAAYYVADGTQTALENVDSGDDAVLFGEKYLNVSDGDYSVDLDSGEVTDDDIVGDTVDDAATSLRKKAKDDTDDRYNDTSTSVGTNYVKNEGTGTYDLAKIPGAKYGEVWYSTAFASNDATTNGGNPYLNVFTDTKGDYIDADYNLGKIKVSTTGDSVNVENTDDNYDFGSGKLSAKVSQTAVIAQDADYIYRTARVTLTSTVDKITAIGGVALDSTTTELGTQATAVSFDVIQKISKEAASEDVDGANYAKTVTTYVVSDENGAALDGANDVLAQANVRYTVAGGKLIAYSTDVANKEVNVRAYTLKSSSGYYYMDEESKSNEDVEVSDNVESDAFDKCAVQTDVDGNLYRLDGGYIYKFDNTDDWDKLYKVDGSFDELSVYDADNMVAWSEDDEVYSLIGGKEATDDNTDTTTPTTPVVTAGWVQAADGTWSYNKADGTKAAGWLNDRGTWYYLKADGIMATGWVNDNGTWYYLNASGAMQTGWLNDNGTWYYLNASGAMLANTTVDGYVLGANGAWVK